MHNWNMSQEIRIKIAKNLEKLRQNIPICKEKLSLALGFDNSYISKLENAKVNITIDKLNKIAKYFNVDVRDLLN